MLKNIKNKMSQLAGNEVLGETSKEDETYDKVVEDKSKSKRKRPSRKKKSKIRNPMIDKEQKDEALNNRAPTVPISRREIDIDMNDSQNKEVIKEEKSESLEEGKTNKDFYRTSKAVEGYEDVLSILAIKETIETDGDFSSSDMDYIEFSETRPIGLNHEEVTDFISRMKYTLHKLETALKQRDRDIVRVASEVKKVEQKMIEKNQEEELERMVGGMTEEERLIEENMEMKVEISGLVNELKRMSDTNESSSALNRKIEALQAENEMLRMGSINGDFIPSKSAASKNKNLPYIKEKPNKLPSFGNSTKDKKTSGLPSFNAANTNDDIEDSIESQQQALLNEIGGLYDE